MVSQRKQDCKILVQRDEQRWQEGRRGDRRRRKLFKVALVRASSVGSEAGLAPTSTASEEVYAHEGDEDQRGEEIDDEQVTDEPEIRYYGDVQDHGDVERGGGLQRLWEKKEFESRLLLNPHSHPNGFYWGRQSSRNHTPANSIQVSNMQSDNRNKK